MTHHDEDAPTFCEYPDCLNLKDPLRRLFDRLGREWWLCPTHRDLLLGGFLVRAPKNGSSSLQEDGTVPTDHA